PSAATELQISPASILGDDIKAWSAYPRPTLAPPHFTSGECSSSLWMNPAPQVFRYTGRQSFGEVYTLCFKGGDKWRCPGAMAPRRERIALHALDGRLMAVPIRTTVCEMPHSVSRRFASGPRTDQTAWALTRT